MGSIATIANRFDDLGSIQCLRRSKNLVHSGSFVDRTSHTRLILSTASVQCQTFDFAAFSICRAEVFYRGLFSSVKKMKFWLSDGA
jgi:hypothetical protein